MFLNLAMALFVQQKRNIDLCVFLTGGELSSLLENFIMISMTPLCSDDVDK